MIGVRVGVGKTAVNDVPMSTSQDVVSITDIDKTRWNLQYLVLWAKSKSKYLNAQSRGATIKGIKIETLQELEVKELSLEKQKNLVNLFTYIKSLISNRQHTLTLLDELVKSRFVEMFGDVKLNAKKWHEEKLGTLVEVGSSKRVFVEELQDEGIPFYRGTEIGQLAERLDIKPELYITQEHYQELCKASGKPCKDDLLMPSICPDGRIWQVDTDKPFYFKDGRVLWIHNICDDINVTFLRYVLKVKFEVDYDKIASGTTFKELKIFILKNLPIIVPSLDLQNQFADFVRQIDVTKTAVQRQLDELQILRAKLMQDYFD